MTAASPLASPALTQAVTRWFGPPVVAALPSVSPDGDHADAFLALMRSVQGQDVVLFPDIWPGHLDGFFRLRLAQILGDQPPAPSLVVVALAADLGGPPLAGGFADRFRGAWPFARCVFVTEGDGAAKLGAALGLPVSEVGDRAPTPLILRTDAAAGQQIAVQLQMTWGRCGSTTPFENQIESLVQTGFFTLRLFWNAQLRRGPTVNALLEQIVPENSVHAGAHVDLLAVPQGPPAFDAVANAAESWAAWMRNAALCQVRDRAATRAIERAAAVVTNHIDTVGSAISLAPAARLLLDVHDDRALAVRQGLEQSGTDPAEIAAEVAAAEYVQDAILGIPDICTHISATEMARLGPKSQRAAIVLPRMYTQPAPPATWARFDVLVVGDGHPANIASLRWFLDAVWRPYLEPAGLRVAIVGRAGERIDGAAYRSPTLHFLGFVDDLDTFRTWCRVSVVADQGGTGVSIKLLTTLAAGHPLVSTRVGMRGLDETIVRDLPAHDDPADFAADLLGLLSDPQRLQQRRQLVTQAHDAIRRGPTFADLVQSVPPPDSRALAARAARWAAVVAAAPAESATPYRFALEESFLMSGSVADRDVLIDGWHEAEPWGRWTDGTTASMRIALPAPADQPLKLELDINPSPIGAALILAIDGSAQPAVAPVAGVNTWSIPPDLIAGKASFVLTLTVADSVCPARTGTVNDTRILGIGVRAVRLTSALPTPCVLDAFLALNSETPPRNVLLQGWHPLEPWGCWSNGLSASLRLTVPEALHGGTLLEVELKPNPACDALTLVANGWSAPPRVPNSGINRWHLPTEVTEGRTELLLTLSVPATYCPADREGSADDRTLGVGVTRVRLRRCDPALVAVGQPLRLTAAMDLADILAMGWHRPEAWGCWTSGHRALLRLSSAQKLSGCFRLELDLSLTPACPLLAVSVNGTDFPAMTPLAGANAWDLPQGCLHDTRDIAIGLCVSDTYCPAEHEPTVDDRILGVGVRSVTLHRMASAICPVGRIAYVGAGHDDYGTLADGWHRREDWGCWTAGADATLRLRLAEPLPSGSRLLLDITPPLIDLVVGVFVNGIACEEHFAIDGPNEWPLPWDAIEGQTLLDVRLHVDHPVRPDAVLASGDDRLLGVGVRSFMLVLPDGT